jgi:hypothetical protein
MVLLAAESDRRAEKQVFLMLNSWLEMPLVGVTAEYIQACKTKVNFLNATPEIDPRLTWNHLLVANCVSPYVFEQGNSGCPPQWFEDGFGFKKMTRFTIGDVFRKLQRAYPNQLF